MVEKLSCFEITALIRSLCRRGKKAAISKQEGFPTTLSRSYIVFALRKKV